MESAVIMTMKYTHVSARGTAHRASLPPRKNGRHFAANRGWHRCASV